MNVEDFKPKPRIQPIEAYKGYRELSKDPERTEWVFVIIQALSGADNARNSTKMKKTAAGRDLLARQPEILDVLCDTERLKAMPLGSLGRTYYEFLAVENLSAEGLVAASDINRIDRETTPEGEWMGKRLRDTHDLWHVLSGYGRDRLGELCLLAFSYPQTGTRGFAFIAMMGALRARKLIPGVPVVKAAWEAYKAGRKATWLPAVEFEKLMERPVVELRRELGIPAPKTYDTVLSGFGAPAPIPLG